MLEHLFVYGTLAPGRPNQHILADVKGSWQPATTKGTLIEDGWGAAQGYPGIVLQRTEQQVDGFLFSSEELSRHWQRLDDFEGEGYQRTLTQVLTSEGEEVSAYVYALAQS